jgi:hypothetical protein
VSTSPHTFLPFARLSAVPEPLLVSKEFKDAGDRVDGATGLVDDGHGNNDARTWATWTVHTLDEDGSFEDPEERDEVGELQSVVSATRGRKTRRRVRRSQRYAASSVYSQDSSNAAGERSQVGLYEEVDPADHIPFLRRARTSPSPGPSPAPSSSREYPDRDRSTTRSRGQFHELSFRMRRRRAARLAGSERDEDGADEWWDDDENPFRTYVGNPFADSLPLRERRSELTEPQSPRGTADARAFDDTSSLVPDDSISVAPLRTRRKKVPKPISTGREEGWLRKS